MLFCLLSLFEKLIDLTLPTSSNMVNGKGPRLAGTDLARSFHLLDGPSTLADCSFMPRNFVPAAHGLHPLLLSSTGIVPAIPTVTGAAPRCASQLKRPGRYSSTSAHPRMPIRWIQKMLAAARKMDHGKRKQGLGERRSPGDGSLSPTAQEPVARETGDERWESLAKPDRMVRSLPRRYLPPNVDWSRCPSL